ncbi:von Willebrand factor type A [Richelia sinica FACHB-800]|jgi:Ca-activated chloride channel family protein|uniref:von Willebrand factor type A n=1 Tax=Richelia sinica FACHB-800 TaxID=1357546 RepID=A0A975TC65_9NOST|nr:VWA domain-containing protein [Richelia sinica]MBD2665145.1 VWA domain-containing protein [Richelia sinica FACHB-800]QXE25899.1 von Willebrand factor type A [Richelia sinica FACHB-800]
MKVSLQPTLSDVNVDLHQATTQRQLAISISAAGETLDRNAPMNLCLALDHSGSMGGRPLETVKQAACLLVDRLRSEDRLSIVVFDHRAKVLIPNQFIEDREYIKQQIKGLSADGGTAIDEGLRLGIEELAKGKKDAISQIFLLTDGENEHGDNDRCLKFAQLAASYNLTLNTLGFGDNWNHDILEKIADAALGSLSYIQQPDQAVAEFSRLFTRMQTVGLTNAYLLISLLPNVRLAELKPVAQVSPDTIELGVQVEPDGRLAVRLGDLMKDVERVVLANIYLGQLPEGKQAIANVQVRYDDPAINQVGLYSQNLPIHVNSTGDYQPAPNPQVQRYILALAKYRQTQLAEMKLQQGDRAGAATMLQTAAKTALQMGDASAATVLQTSATRLQAGEELSESDRKKTKIVSKTVLQDAPRK